VELPLSRRHSVNPPHLHELVLKHLSRVLEVVDLMFGTLCEVARDIGASELRPCSSGDSSRGVGDVQVGCVVTPVWCCCAGGEVKLLI
jgi:hypothetical protein